MVKIRFLKTPRLTEMPRTQVQEPKPPEIKIKSKLQSSNYDCGQACLDMLGYDGQKMFPGRAIWSLDIMSIPGTRDATVPIGNEETLDYSYPHLWLVLIKGREADHFVQLILSKGLTEDYKFTGTVSSPGLHWVIRHEDKIFCPRFGETDAQKYKETYVHAVLQEFIVPFKGFR